MLPAVINLELYKGDTARFLFRFSPLQSIDFKQAQWAMSIQPLSGEAVLIGNTGFELTEQDGQFLLALTLLPEQTKAFNFKSAKYDIQARQDEYTVRTITRGTIQVIQDITS